MNISKEDFIEWLVFVAIMLVIVAAFAIPMARSASSDTPLQTLEPDTIEATVQALPDPCFLDSVECEDELKVPESPTFGPCDIHLYAESCTPYERNKIMFEQQIWDAAIKYAVDPETAVRIAKCESSLDPRASNPNSSAKGIFQFTDTTWEWINAPGHQFDAEENIKQFMIWYQVYPSWWICQ